MQDGITAGEGSLQEMVTDLRAEAQVTRAAIHADPGEYTVLHPSRAAPDEPDRP